MLKVVTFLLIASCCIVPSQAVSTWAESAILVELESGRVLFEENPQEEKLIASITKLMTAFVALESDIPLQQMVEITAESYGTEGSSLYLELGEEISLEALLYGLLLHSGNDAAVAIAVACAGSEAEFVEKMNAKAQELAMEQSHFANPHGLNAENHYSTAYDMALLGRACLQNETLAEMVSTQSIRIDNRSFTNKNKLLWNYEGCIGMKTGYTELAGRTLVSAAERDGMTLVCVTLNDRNDWVDHSALFDHGFASYDLVEWDISVEIPNDTGLLPFVTATMAEPFCYPVGDGEEITWELYNEPQWKKGVLGEESGVWVIFYCGETEIQRAPLLYAEEFDTIVPEKKSFWEKLFS